MKFAWTPALLLLTAACTVTSDDVAADSAASTMTGGSTTGTSQGGGDDAPSPEPTASTSDTATGSDGDAQLGFVAVAYTDLYGDAASAPAPDRLVDDLEPVFATGSSTGGTGSTGAGGSTGGASTGGVETGSTVAPLTSLILTVTRLDASTDGTMWETIYDGSGTLGIELDLIAGTGSIPPSSVPAGTYNHLFVQITGVTYGRGEACVDQEIFDMPLESALGGILTTQVVAEDDYGQDWNAILTGDFESALPSTPPSAVHPDANDDFFWLLADEFTIAEGLTSLVVSALPDPVYTAPEACDFAPGKPIFVVGTTTALMAFDNDQ